MPEVGIYKYVQVTAGEWRALHYYRRHLKDITKATLVDAERLREMAELALAEGRKKEKGEKR